MRLILASNRGVINLKRGATVTESELWVLQRFRLLETLNDDQRETIRKVITISEL
jgi:hypothetical protein